MEISLQEKLSKSFFTKFVLPMFLSGMLLMLSVISFHFYIFSKIEPFEMGKANHILENLLEDKKKVFTDRISNIEAIATMLQKEHEQIFHYKNIGVKKVDFAIAKNGVYYKTTRKGASLYYSSATKIGKEQRAKALFTENMDASFKALVDKNRLIAGAYFSSYDNMNRYYPYLPKVYEQFGPSLVMKNYNFYYLADKKHNPGEKPVWTGAYLDPAGKGWVISCLVPIYNGDFLEGVTGIDISLKNIVDRIFNKKLSYDAKMLLINKDGTITAMSKGIRYLVGVEELAKYNYTEPIKEPIKEPKEFNIFHSKKRFLHELTQMIDQKKDAKEIVCDGSFYTVFQKRLIDGSTLVLFAKKSIILENMNYIKKSSMIAISIFILIILLILFLEYRSILKYYKKLSNNIVKPITILSHISKDSATSSDLDIPKVGILEIDILSENFTKMLKELQEFNSSLILKVNGATKELEEKNRFANILLDTTMEAIIIFDEEYKAFKINKVALNMFKLTAEQDLSIYNVYEFVPQNELSKMQEALSKPNSNPWEINLYRKDKTIFPALVHGRDTMTNNKKFRISTIIDLSEIKEKEQQLQQHSKLVQMGDMISMIAHQWRQPLNAISASSINLSMLSEMEMLEDKKAQEASKFIQNQCQVMSQTINTFMNFVKPTQESKEFQISHAFDAIMQIIGAQLKNHGIKVNIEKSDTTLVGHEDLLEQVIINLLTNARDSFEEREIENKFINISVEKKDDIPVIIVEDNAGGIPQEIQNKVFNPYFTTKEQGKGTGIGLYMSLDIMRKSFKGDLVLHPIENGSRFEILCGGGVRYR